MSLRAVRYHRVSTDEQTVDAQRDATAKYLANENWIDAGCFDDIGASGKNLERPEFKRALEILRNRQADVLIAAKLDRLSRSVLDFSNLMLESEREGGALVVCDIKLDTGSPHGRFVAQVFMALAEMERELGRQRTKDALQALKRRGIRLGKQSKLTPSLMAELQEMRSRGGSWLELAEVAGVQPATVAYWFKRERMLKAHRELVSS